MREAYRRNKRELYEHLISRNIQIAFVVILRGNIVPEYGTVEKAMKEMVNKLVILSSKNE